MGENILKLIRPADIITLMSALLGLGSIILAGSGQVDGALVLILIAVIADVTDGAIARQTGHGVLGANLDSLADAVSFGVAPAAAIIFYLQTLGTSIAAGFFTVCGILRLARFNVAGKKDGFEGIPITAGGFIVALFLLARIPYAGISIILLVIILSLLMVSAIGYPKLRNPVVLAPMGILLILDIAVYYLDYPDLVRTASLILLIFAFAYVLSPVGRRFYDRNK